MFSKTTLVSLALGVLYVNAFTLPVAREPAPEPESQDLDARGISPNALAAGFMGIAAGAPLVGMWRDRNKSKREAEAEIQELEARLHPAVIPAMAAASTLIGMSGVLDRPKNRGRSSDELFLREPINGVQATAALAGLSTITPLVAKWYSNRKQRREISDELFAREPEAWTEWAEAVLKREPHLHGKGKKGKKGKTGKKGKKSRS